MLLAALLRAGSLGVDLAKGRAKAGVQRALRQAAVGAAMLLFLILAFSFGLAAFTVWLAREIGTVPALGFIGLFFLVGVANMAFVIPNITLFQERTPQALFARVVTSRQALVFGVMAAAMAVSGIVAGVIGADRTLMVGGAVAVGAGVIGLLIPAMRNAK